MIEKQDHAVHGIFYAIQYTTVKCKLWSLNMLKRQSYLTQVLRNNLSNIPIYTCSYTPKKHVEKGNGVCGR